VYTGSGGEGKPWHFALIGWPKAENLRRSCLSGLDVYGEARNKARQTQVSSPAKVSNSARQLHSFPEELDSSPEELSNFANGLASSSEELSSSSEELAKGDKQ